jgi:hypothetical protein
VTWRIVDDDVEYLHVERNRTMACSGSHLYKFYRFLENYFIVMKFSGVTKINVEILALVKLNK